MDELIEEMQSTSSSATAWSRLSPGEWYPPPSILVSVLYHSLLLSFIEKEVNHTIFLHKYSVCLQNLLSPVLLLEVSKQSKLKLLGYFLLDITAATQGTDVHIGVSVDCRFNSILLVYRYYLSSFSHILL